MRVSREALQRLVSTARSVFISIPVLLFCVISIATCGTSTLSTSSSTTIGAQATLQSLDATATANVMLPYQASSPGPCDRGGGIWYESNDASPSAFTCQADGLHISTDLRSTTQGNAPSILFEGAYGASVATAYAISITAAALTTNACIVLSATPSQVGMYDGRGYLFHLCQNGTWDMITGGRMQQGTFASAHDFLLTLTRHGGETILLVNGASVASITVTMLRTHFVAIGLQGLPQGGAVVTLRQFTYQPLI